MLASLPNEHRQTQSPQYLWGSTVMITVFWTAEIRLLTGGVKPKRDTVLADWASQLWSCVRQEAQKTREVDPQSDSANIDLLFLDATSRCIYQTFTYAWIGSGNKAERVLLYEG
jgi:hypothetical protein